MLLLLLKGSWYAFYIFEIPSALMTACAWECMSEIACLRESLQADTIGIIGHDIINKQYHMRSCVIWLNISTALILL